MTTLQAMGMMATSTTEPTDLNRYSGALISSERIPLLIATAILMMTTSTMDIAWPQRMIWPTDGIEIQLVA